MKKKDFSGKIILRKCLLLRNCHHIRLNISHSFLDNFKYPFNFFLDLQPWQKYTDTYDDIQHESSHHSFQNINISKYFDINS